MKVPNASLEGIRRVQTFGFFDDFDHFLAGAADRWSTSSTGGTNAIRTTAPIVGGWVNLSPSGATPAADDAAYIYGTNSIYQLVSGQSIFLEALIHYAEVNTNYANVIFGLISGTVTSALQNTSAGPNSNFYGAVIYKKGLGTVWRTMSSLGTTQIDNVSKNTAGGTAYQRLGIRIDTVTPGATSNQFLTVSYFLNDQPLLLNNTYMNIPIKDTTTFTSPVTTYLYPVLGIKNGATVSGGAESLDCDYFQIWQKRIANTADPD